MQEMENKKIKVDTEPEGESAYPDSECRKEVVTCVCPVCEPPISAPHLPGVYDVVAVVEATLVLEPTRRQYHGT